MEFLKYKTGEEIWAYFAKSYNHINAPLVADDLLEAILKELKTKVNVDRARSILGMLKFIAKDDHFDYELISQYFRKQNPELREAAINSMHHSTSTKAQRALLDLIIDPKSDYNGETAVKVLFMIITDVNIFDELIRCLPSLKKLTKKQAEYLIYVKSYDNIFDKSLEIKNYFVSKKVRSMEKYNFKSYKKSSVIKIKGDILKKVEAFSKKEYTSAAAFNIYVPISDYLFNSFRVVVDFPFTGRVLLSLGIKSYWTSYYGWINNHGTNDTLELYEMNYSDLMDEDSELSKKITMWIDLTKEYDGVLEKYDRNLNIKHLPSYIINQDEYRDLGFFDDLALINFALYKNNQLKAKEVANSLLENKFDKLGEFWVGYCKNIEHLTLTDLRFNKHIE